MPAAEASGSRGRSVTSDPKSGPTFDASTPPLAQTNPCGVSVMRTPFSMRTTRRASSRTTWTWRGVAVVALGELDRLRAGDDAGQVDDGAFGLGHDLLGHDQHVVVASAAGRPASARGRRR